jgi:transcriptional regulator, propionate catabolism operon regulatory protein
MKVKALFVAPYAAMENLIEECREKEPEIDLQIRIGNLQEGVAIAKNAEAEGFDVIISRGGTAKLIGEAVDLPVVDVRVSGYDMLRVFTLANDFPRKKAIVGFSNITLGAKAIIDLLDIPIDIFTIDHEEQTEPLLQRLKQEGYQLILGDVVTYETASRLGLLGILIQSGREAIFDAFKEAKTVSRWMMKNKREVERLKAILNAAVTDFIVLSENGEVIYEQWESFPSRSITVIPIGINPIQVPLENNEITHVIDHNGEPLKITTKKIITKDRSYYLYEITRMEINPALLENLNIRVLSAPIIIHQSAAMNSCLAMIQRSLSYSSFILIGKRGTGKELIAQYIHYHRFQGIGLFASINACDFLELNPEKVDKDIKTIYIHTVEQLETGFRKELLRKIKALKGHGFTIILAMIDEQPGWGNMIYEDETIRIQIPALAERADDLRELVSSFLAHFHQSLGTSAIKLKEESLALLAKYEWPGNVKELKALLKDAVLMEKGYIIEKQIIEKLISRKKGIAVGVDTKMLQGSLEEIEKKIIEYVLKEEDYNQTKAAKRLHINRSTLWRKLKQEF